MKLDEKLLLFGERVLFAKKANFIISISDYGLSRFSANGLMWTIGMKGKEAIGGKLYLTNYRCIFISHSINRVTGSIEIFLPAINNAYDSSRGIVKSITLETKLANFQFVVWGIPKLLAQIDHALSETTVSGNFQLSKILKGSAPTINDNFSLNVSLELINKVFLFAKVQSDDLLTSENPLALMSTLLLEEAIKNLQKQDDNPSNE